MRYEFFPKENLNYYSFDGMEEMASEALPVAKKWGGLTESYVLHPEKNGDWIGRHFSGHKEAFDAVNQVWPEGMEIYDRMSAELGDSNLPKPKSIRRRPSWSEDLGDEVDLDRLRRGDPYWRTTSRDSRPGPISVTIVTNISTSCSVDSKNVLWRGAAAVCLSNLLEQAGYRVELLVGNHLGHAYKDGTRLLLTSCLKRNGDPLDISTLINSVSGWTLRTLFFASYHHYKVQPSGGYGGPLTLTSLLSKITPDEQAISCENIWSYSAAVTWVREELTKLEQKHAGVAV